jgi:demethylmenaquinone methyltransferase/2-methoxy-6-polyprenyl-1,4-benzoquinol methylase
MKLLESVPSRYDRGIRILTLGEIDSTYDRLISHLKSNWKVLDIGCGTGALTLKAAQKGCSVVKGIDINPQMLEIAKRRIKDANLTINIELEEMGVLELEKEESNSYHAVMSSLCFSELSEEELIYTIEEIKRILKPGGILLVADEVRPQAIIKILLHWLVRIPLVIITYILTQTSTRAVKNLPEKIKKAGFIIESVRLNKLGDFMELKATKPL